MADNTPLSERIAVELARGSLDLVRTPGTASIPTPGDSIASLKKTLVAVKALLDSRTGTGGSAYDQWVSTRDLINAGAISMSVGGSTIGSIPSIPGGGGDGDPRPFLVTPPTPTNLTVQGSYKHVVLSWDLTSYRNHSFTEVWRSTTNSVGTAAAIAQAAANIYADDTAAVSTVYYYWVRAVGFAEDGSTITGAYNAVGGTSGGLGLIGNVDLGPLIVEAGNLASGAVTAGKIAAGAVELTKFASGIEPVTIVSSVPGALVTQTIFNTADDKLYRWNGVAYVKSVDGGDITAGSIVAGKIAAGAIGANEIAAGAITTGKLLVTGQGAALNTDPHFADPSHWGSSAGAGHALVFATNPGTGGVAPTYLSVRSADTWVLDENPPFPIDPGLTYIERAHVYSEFAGGTGALYLAVNFYDGTGAFIANYGWGGSWTGYTVAGVVPAAGWNAYSGDFGAGTSRPIPPQAKSCRVGVILKYGTSDSTAEWGVQNLRVERKIGADLIVDGAIIAGKIAANAIAVGTAAIENGAINNAMIANLAVDNAKIANGTIQDAKIANLDAAKITTGFLDAARINTGSLNANKITSGTITSAQIAASTITGGNIAGSTITAGNISVTSLAAVSTTTGTLTVDSAGHIKGGQTAYATGNGFFLGYSGGQYKLSIGDPAGASVTWDGAALTITNATLDSFSASMSAGAISVAVANGQQSYTGIRTAIPSGGKSPYSYRWSTGAVYSDNGTFATMGLDTTLTSASMTFQGNATNNQISAWMTCTITDANGRTAATSVLVTATHGTYIP